MSKDGQIRQPKLNGPDGKVDRHTENGQPEVHTSASTYPAASDRLAVCQLDVVVAVAAVVLVVVAAAVVAVQEPEPFPLWSLDLFSQTVGSLVVLWVFQWAHDRFMTAGCHNKRDAKNDQKQKTDDRFLLAFFRLKIKQLSSRIFVSRKNR